MLEISRSEWRTKTITLVANKVTRVAITSVRRISLLILNTGLTDAYAAERDNVATSGDLAGVPLKASIGTTLSFSAVIGMDGKKRIYDGPIYVVSTGTPTICVAEESEID